MGSRLNSLNGGCRGDNICEYYRVTKGDTRSLDQYSSCGGFLCPVPGFGCRVGVYPKP